MAQLIFRSSCLRPFCQQFSVCLQSSNLPSRTLFTGCGGLGHPSHAVSRLRSTSQNQPIGTTSFISTSANTKTDDSTKFHLIYKFPAIAFCRAVSRLKLLQTTITAFILPPVFYYYLQGQVTEGAVVYCTGIALFAGAMLYALTYYLRRIIGMLYVDDKMTTVKVSHLTFWGNRKNIFVPVEDIKRLSETGDGKREVLRQFARYSRADILYFTTRFGYVLDKEKFKVIFGELE
ncbi:Transmembrane protein 186, partial [Pristimantis euphronides]